VDEEDEEEGPLKEPAGEYVLRRDLSRTLPVSVELFEDIDAEKEMGLEACCMSQASSSSWGVSTSEWGYSVGLCRNIAASRSSLQRGTPNRSGPLTCSPPFKLKHGCRRKGTSNAAINHLALNYTPQIKEIEGESAHSSISLLSFTMPRPQRRWPGVRAHNRFFPRTID
jgi:hypothetical protein